MNRNPLGVETKVARPAYAGLVAGAALELTHWIDPGLRLPPAGLVVLCLTAVTSVVAYYAPHTPQSPAVQSAQERADFEDWTAAGKPLVSPRRAGDAYRGGKPASEMGPPPADVPSGAVFQPGGTGTGPAKGDTP